MIRGSIEGGLARTWIVCDDVDRWLTPVRQFAPALMPENLAVTIVACQPSEIPAALVGGGQAVLLWGVRREAVIQACDHVAKVSLLAPHVLQVLAAEGLADRELAALSELGCRAIVRHPEQLPGLSRMIHGYFASPA